LIYLKRMNEGNYTIGEFARLFGVSPRTIDFYTRQGLLHPEQGGRGHGYRHYTEEDRRRVSLIKQLQVNKFFFTGDSSSFRFFRQEGCNLGCGSDGKNGPGSEKASESRQKYPFFGFPTESTRHRGARYGGYSKGHSPLLGAGDPIAGFAIHVGGLKRRKNQWAICLKPLFSWPALPFFYC